MPTRRRVNLREKLAGVPRADPAPSGGKHAREPEFDLGRKGLVKGARPAITPRCARLAERIWKGRLSWRPLPGPRGPHMRARSQAGLPKQRGRAAPRPPAEPGVMAGSILGRRRR